MASGSQLFTRPPPLPCPFKGETNQDTCVAVLLLLFDRSVVSDPANPWTVAHKASLSMRFPRQEYLSELLFPSLGDLSDPGIEPVSPASLLHCR